MLTTNKFAGTESATETGSVVTQVDGSSMAVTDSTSIDGQNTEGIEVNTVTTENDIPPQVGQFDGQTTGAGRVTQEPSTRGTVTTETAANSRLIEDTTAVTDVGRETTETDALFTLIDGGPLPGNPVYF